MDLNEARRLVVEDTREGDPERWAGKGDAEVLASLAEDGVDAVEVKSWAGSGVVSGSLLDAYLMVVEG